MRLCLDWSTDASFLLMTSRSSGPKQIDLFDLRMRRRTPFLVSGKYSLFQSRLSPDQRWLAFFSLTEYGEGGIFISPVLDRAAADEGHWMRIGQRGVWHDKPRWSPDGRYLYFVAEQDGFRCVYAQRLDPSTKRPAGPPVGVHHLHSARLSMGNIGYGQLEIGFAADKLVFNLGELTGNIWMLTKLTHGALSTN
jgi:Tol biopolymer transport system component